MVFELKGIYVLTMPRLFVANWVPLNCNFLFKCNYPSRGVKTVTHDDMFYVIILFEFIIC